MSFRPEQIYDLKANEVKGKSPSSTKWLRRKAGDQYTKKAKRQGYVARSAFKIEEMIHRLPNKKYIRNIVELGAAPGGWTQIVHRHFPRCKIIALDLQKMNPIQGTIQIQLDFTDPKSHDVILENLRGGGIDLLLSDMAPAFSGIASVDHLRMMGLAEAAFRFGKEHMNPGSSAILKVNRGGTENELKKEFENYFEKVYFTKPDASFKTSSEIYLVGNYFKKEEPEEESKVESKEEIHVTKDQN